MRKNLVGLIKPLTAVSALLATAWLVGQWRSPGLPWEPAIALIGALIAYITIEMREHAELSRARDVQLNNDAGLFRQLQELLPSHAAIDFIKHHDFGGSFRLRDLDPVQSFTREWDNPQHEFNDSELEAQRSKLLRAAKYFAGTIAVKTTPRRHLQSVVPEHIPSDGPFPDWIKRDAREIRQAADALVTEHEKMMRTGRKKLPQQNLS